MDCRVGRGGTTAASLNINTLDVVTLDVDGTCPINSDASSARSTPPPTLTATVGDANGELVSMLVNATTFEDPWIGTFDHFVDDPTRHLPRFPCQDSPRPPTMHACGRRVRIAADHAIAVAPTQH